MPTAQALITDSRIPLNDTDSTAYRNSDANLLVGLNDGLKLIRAVRPDLWYGTLATPLVSLALIDPFPLEPQYEPAIKKYIVHFVEMQDDQYATSGRAKAFLEMFVNEIAKGI